MITIHIIYIVIWYSIQPKNSFLNFFKRKGFRKGLRLQLKDQA